MADRVGQHFGNYRLLRLLGEGSFAEVYLGEHIYLGTQAAIKILHTQLTSNGVDKFRAEARTIARLIHPYIVRVLDFDVEGKIPFLVMDYVQNGSLRQLCPKGVVLPLPRIVSYVRQVADALQYAHNEKLIHRDIKPENLLLGESGEIVLSDFGIAAIAHDTASLKTGGYAGTIHYSAPEQIQGKPRPASDQYSLAIVVYEWLCGERPFHGSFNELYAQHLFASPQSLRRKVPTISPEIEQVVLKALEKDPHNRYSSIQDFAAAFERAAASVGGRVPPANRRIMRRTILLSLAIAGLAMTGVAGWWELSHPLGSRTPTLKLTPIPLGKLLYTYRGHSNIVKNVAWSSDGKRIASGSFDKTVQVWDAVDGSHVLTYRGHSGSANAVAWSPDGRRIASASNDTTVQVWDAADGGHVFTYRGHTAVMLAVAWSPDGKRIASASNDTTVQVWDATDGGHAFTYRGHSDIVDTVAWSPDSRRIASGSYDQTVQVWDAVDGSHVFTYRGHSHRVNAVAWSPNGHRIASGSDDTTVQVWDAADGGHVFTYKGHSNLVEAVAWSPDGKRIASGSFDKTVQEWNATDGSHAFTYQGHSNIVDTVAWSPDGRRIASGSYDRTVEVWGAGSEANSAKQVTASFTVV